MAVRMHERAAESTQRRHRSWRPVPVWNRCATWSRQRSSREETQMVYVQFAWVRHALLRICEGHGGECSRDEGGKHAICQGSITKAMAKYPRELCRAVLRGLTAQLRCDRRLVEGCYGIQAQAPCPPQGADCEGAAAEEQLYGPAQCYWGEYKDDLTGQPLLDDLAKAARAKEFDFFCSKGVWLRVPRPRRPEGHPSLSGGST